MRERAHTTGDQRCAQTAQTGHAHRKQRKHRNSEYQDHGDGHKTKGNSTVGGVTWGRGRISNLHFTRFTRNKFIRKKPVFFKRKDQKMYKEKCTFLFS